MTSSDSMIKKEGTPGGIVIYAHESLKVININLKKWAIEITNADEYILLKNQINPDLYILALAVQKDIQKNGQNKPTLVVTIYRSPAVNVVVSNIIVDYLRFICKYLKHLFESILITDDFNCHADWRGKQVILLIKFIFICYNVLKKLNFFLIFHCLPRVAWKNNFGRYC